nr:ABC transporter permease [Aminipila butyrica]
MRVWALAKRILLQLKHDKRTLALTLLAPLLILTLLYFVFESAEDTVTIGIINGSQAFREALYENNGVIVDCQDLEPLEKGQVAAVATVESGKLQVWMDGSDSTQAARAIKALEAASKGIQPVRKDRMADITYVYGAEDLSLFDNFASILTGFLVFFFVFLISGISFLKERTTGTLEKVLSTPFIDGKWWADMCWGMDWSIWFSQL